MERIWKEAVMDYFEVLCRNVPEENYEKLQSR
jgi:hypothetical protein